jgi:hypothetical protein
MLGAEATMTFVHVRALRSRAAAWRAPGGRCVWPLLAVLLGAVACDGSSPGAPGAPPPPAAAVVFVDPQGLAAEQAAITALLQQTAEQAGRVLPLGFVRFTVSTERARLIPGWGFGGYTVGPSDIDVIVDPAYPGLAQILAERLPPLAAHELHHAARWQGIGYPYSTLLEALATEGLADHFAIGLTGSPIPPWCDAFPETQTEEYLDRALPELDAAYDHGAWFFGRGPELPNWTGYTLGFRLVGDYLTSHPGSSAAGLVHAPAEAFRPD